MLVSVNQVLQNRSRISVQDELGARVSVTFTFTHSLARLEMASVGVVGYPIAVFRSA